MLVALFILYSLPVKYVTFVSSLFRGNSENAVKLFEKALELVRTEGEMASTFSLLEAAKAQTKVVKDLGIKLPGGMM